jgi:hypothetical protein
LLPGPPIRQDIASKHVDGRILAITPTDVLQRAAADMSRRPERGSSLDMLERVVDKRHGSVVEFQRGSEPVERQARTLGLSAFRELRLALSPVMRRVHEMTRRMGLGLQRQAREHDGPSLER